ncbi:alpha-1-antitrypsin [Acrasis kona]|uniref:Alpha-1-antitrypsin n=1 Tax=Acrasis kona TaxID=1008807 RepID=A0AAW2Z287_9EUKA
MNTEDQTTYGHISTSYETRVTEEEVESSNDRTGDANFSSLDSTEEINALDGKMMFIPSLNTMEDFLRSIKELYNKTMIDLNFRVIEQEFNNVVQTLKEESDACDESNLEIEEEIQGFRTRINLYLEKLPTMFAGVCSFAGDLSIQ